MRLAFEFVGTGSTGDGFLTGTVDTVRVVGTVGVDIAVGIGGIRFVAAPDEDKNGQGDKG